MQAMFDNLRYGEYNTVLRFEISYNPSVYLYLKKQRSLWTSMKAREGTFSEY